MEGSIVAAILAPALVLMNCACRACSAAIDADGIGNPAKETPPPISSVPVPSVVEEGFGTIRD